VEQEASSAVDSTDVFVVVGSDDDDDDNVVVDDDDDDDDGNEAIVDVVVVSLYGTVAKAENVAHLSGVVMLCARC
jgi:hypothetical protein